MSLFVQIQRRRRGARPGIDTSLAERKTRQSLPGGRSAARLRSGDGALAVMAIPALALFGVFFLAPVVAGLYYALTNWDGVSQARFVGLANFRQLLSDPAVPSAARHTLILSALILIVQIPLGLGLALLVDRRRRGVAFFRAILFAPALISTAVVAAVWGLIYSPLSGALQTVFESVGLQGLATAGYLTEPNLVLVSIAVVVIWEYAGYTMIIYLAGLQTIPNELYEAASIDGAGTWQTFRWVTVPSLRTATAVNVTISLIGCLRLFDVVWLLTQGGPVGESETVGTLIYRAAFVDGRFGYSAALSVVLTVVVCVLAMAQFGLLRRGEEPM